MNSCKICNGPTTKIFSKIILKKYSANYYKCNNCGFVQTSEPVWLEEAYDSAITSLDIGLLQRNIQFSSDISSIIDACFPEAKIMLDYAGGYGVFTRLMRDLGYHFYRQDPYCENLFSKYFDITDIKNKTFDVVTAFEVFEHFADPLMEIDKLSAYSENIIFSTVLTPKTNQEIENWWYISEETGQHVAFYSAGALEFIAKKMGKNYYSKNGNMHLFTSKKLSTKQIDYAFKNKRHNQYLFGLIKQKIQFHVQRESLLETDLNHIKTIISS